MLSFTLLGSVVMSKDNDPLTRFRSQKEAALLIYLAHTEDTYQREFIADLLWESSSTKQALSNLRTILARLRKQLGDDAFHITRKTIGLAPGRYRPADSVVLVKRLAAIRGIDSAAVATEFHTLLKSYHGEFCSGFYLKDGNNYNDWLTQTQEEIRREVVFGYEKLSSYAQSQQNNDWVIEIAQDWLKIDELNEAAHTLLIRNLIDGGHQQRAKAQYDHCVSLFEKELGISPPAELSTLMQAIQQNLARTGSTPEHNLPSEYDPFFGREQDVQEINGRLNQPSCRLVTLAGKAGIGKTRLATHLAWGRLGQHPDGVWRVDLSDIDHDDPDIGEAIAVEIATSLELRLTGNGTPADQLLSHLKQHNSLLVLDQFEHLLPDGADFVLEIIQRCPKLKLIVSSHAPLAVAPEWLIELDGLSHPAEDEPIVESDYPAVELFIARRAQKQHRPMEPDELEGVYKITSLVQGHPLALELAASLTQFMSVGAILANLSSGFDTRELSDWIETNELDQLISAIKSDTVVRRLNPDKVRSRLDPLPDQTLFGVDAPRAKAIAALESLEAPWMVTLDGLGGIGKTSLANELVHHFIDIDSDRFLDIAWISAKQDEYVTGRGIQSTRKPALDSESCIDQLLAQLADGPYPANSFEVKRDALSDILRKKPSLLVIDNLETIEDFEELLPLIRYLSGPSKFLITTRVSLRNEADIYCLNLSELAKPDAIAFVRHEATVQEIGSLKLAADSVYDDIYQTIGGNPLALKLAIGQAHFLPLEHILSGLRQSNQAEISQLYVYIYWQAWQVLDTNSRHLFVSLPMVPNGTFEQLSIASGLVAGELAVALKMLRSLSLIEMGHGDGGQARYRIHRLTETFLLNEVIKWQMPDSHERQPESEQFEERLNIILKHWQADEKIVTITTEELDEEKDGILKAIQFGLDFEPSWPLVKQLIPTLTGYMERRGHWAVWYDVLNRAIEVAQRLEDLNAELMIANMRGRILQRLSRQNDLIQNYWYVIRLANQAGNQIEKARACSNLGFNFIDRGYFWRAKVLNCHALEIFNSQNYLHGQAHTNNHLGYLHTKLREWHHAEIYLNTACDIWEQMQDKHGLLKGFINLAVLNNENKSPNSAITLLGQALEIVEEIGEASSLPIIYFNLSEAYLLLEDYKKAEDFAHQAEIINRNNENFYGVYQAQMAKGVAMVEQNNWEVAQKYLESSKRGFQSLHNKPLEIRVELELLKGYISVENIDDAQSSLNNLQKLNFDSTQIGINERHQKIIEQANELV